MHMLPAVTDIMQTREHAEFADRVLACHGRAYQQYALDISPAMRQTLAEMQACLNQQCGIAACVHPDMMAKLIAEKFAAINQAQPEVLTVRKILLMRLWPYPHQPQQQQQQQITASCHLSYILSA